MESTTTSELSAEQVNSALDVCADLAGLTLVLTHDTEDEAIAAANDSNLGFREDAAASGFKDNPTNESAKLYLIRQLERALERLNG